MSRLRWTYRADKPRKEKMFYKTNVPIRINLETVAMFFFDNSDNQDIGAVDFDWCRWSASLVIKKIKDVIRWTGTQGLYIDDSDCHEEVQWNLQPDFVQDWFINQAAKLFPEIDILSPCNKKK